MGAWFQVLLAVAGAIVTADAAIRVVGTVAGRTVGRRGAALRRLQRLAAHVSADYFASVLGAPIFSRNGNPWTELVWVDPAYYFVQAWCDNDGRVAVYSVTSRSTKFRPTVPFPNRGRYWASNGLLAARLNRTCFSEIGDDPRLITADLLARRHAYVEH